MLHAKLIVVGGEAKTKEVQLKFPCILGRGKGSTLLLQHPLVSRQHCEIFEANGKLMVRDMGSLNGTYVNKEKITEAVLPSGHLLTVGSVTFRAEYNELKADTSPQDRPTTVVSAEEFSQHARTEQAPEAEDVEEVEEISYGQQAGALPNFEMASFEDEPAAPSPPPTAPIAVPVATPAPMAIPVAPVAIPVTPAAPVAEEDADNDDGDLDDFLRSLKK